jgi:CheY-like chemotaxis protein
LNQLGEHYVEEKRARNANSFAIRPVPPVGLSRVARPACGRKERVDVLVVSAETVGDGMDESDKSTRPAEAKLKPMVYVVDDEPMVGDVVQAILKLGGYQSAYFQEPVLALEAIKSANPKPDLLLTDFQMPQMTGRELIHQCKQIDPGLKTILYSGNVQEDTVSLYPSKPDRFLRKPFTPQTLIELVESVVAQ